MTEKEFIKLANKILYVKQSARTPFGGKKSELKGLKKLYKAINYTHCCTEFFCEDEDLEYSSKKCKEQCSGCKFIENL